MVIMALDSIVSVETIAQAGRLKGAFSRAGGNMNEARRRIAHI
jgi:hypothetical protein